MLGIVGDERDVQEDDPGLEREVDDLPKLGHLLSLGGARGHRGDGRSGEAGERALGDVAAPEGGGVRIGRGLHDLRAGARGGLAEEALWTRRPWKAEARAMLEVAVALEGAATREAAEAAFTMEAISLQREGGYGLRVRATRA